MEFYEGETLYTPTGTTVSFDHAHGDMGYVRPILVTRVQCTSYSGDSFHEEEVEDEADHLIAIPLDSLSRVKPVAALDDAIAEKQGILADLIRKIGEAEKHHRAKVGEYARMEDRLDSDLAKRRKKYPLFEETMRFLEGQKQFALSVSEGHYTNLPNVPHIPKDENLRYIRLRPVQKPYRTIRKEGTEEDKLEWVAVTKSFSGDISEAIQLFFPTEEERDEHISAMFDKVCERFRVKPDYRQLTYTSSLDFGVLLQWVTRFTFLVIPDDIEEAKRESDRAEEEAKRAHLRAQLAQLEGHPS